MNVKFSELNSNFNPSFGDSKLKPKFNPSFGEVQIVNISKTNPPYEGNYTVTPSTENEITLETAQKLMLADVKVEKIPYAEVSNNKGGKTATIG